MMNTEYVDTYVIESYVDESFYINNISLAEVLSFSKEEPVQDEEEGESSKVVFEPRLDQPSRSDSNWIVTSRGGSNRCINISQGYVVPNCVGYAWGRWSELLGETHNLSNSNAEKWYLNTADGYDRGQEPQVGAVACWSKGSPYSGYDGAGHVAIVEEVYEDGSILISESSYGGTAFTTRVLDNNYSLSGQVFQGFIYIPLSFYTEEELREQEEAALYQKQLEVAYNKLVNSFHPTVNIPTETNTVEKTVFKLISNK